MNTDRMQTQRFELKYQVTEATARAVREFVRCYLEPDTFGADRSAPAYPVHSLYLDSDALDLFHSTVNGDRNRFKLRVRFYDDAPDSPVYFEIKRRVDRCIHKQRARVRREAVAALLAGEAPRLSHLAKPDARAFTALQNFCAHLRQLGAKPRAHVAYDREAWLTPANNAIRVTMDRHVRCELQREPQLTTRFDRPVVVFPQRVILELKFTDRFPEWFRHLAEAHNLSLASAAKYVDGIAQIDPERFTPATALALARRAGAAPSHLTSAIAAVAPLLT